MAKRMLSKIKKTKTKVNKAGAGKGYGEKFKLLMENPQVRYVAGGIATTLLAKAYTKLSGKYPEISQFIKQNLDVVEHKLAEFKNALDESDSANLHH